MLIDPVPRDAEGKANLRHCKELFVLDSSWYVFFVHASFVVMPLSVRRLHPNFASPWKKGTARLFVSEGGSDPEKLLGGLAAKKFGRSRPFQSFFHGDLSFHWGLYLLRVKEIPRATE